MVSFLNGIELSSFGSHTISELDTKAPGFFLLYFELRTGITVIRGVFAVSRVGSGQGSGGIRARIVVVRGGFANSGWAGFFGSVGTGRHEVSLLELAGAIEGFHMDSEGRDGRISKLGKAHWKLNF